MIMEHNRLDHGKAGERAVDHIMAGQPRQQVAARPDK